MHLIPFLPWAQLIAGSSLAGPASWPDLVEPPPGLDRREGRHDAALIVGIEDYTYLPDIPGAARNAQEWERWMVHRGVAPARIQLLVDRVGGASGTPAGTKEAILRAARQAATSVSESGKLWLVFIGHGAPAVDDVLLLGTDTSRSADGFAARGIRRSELLDTLGTRAATNVVVLDTCFSGQGVEGEMLLEEALAPALMTKLAGQTSTLELFATSRDQFAGPLPQSERPAFSYLILGALRGWGDEAQEADADGVVTAREALAYAKETLRMLVRGRSQEPDHAAEPASLVDVALARSREAGPDRRAIRDALYGAPGSTEGLDPAVRERLWDDACDQAAREVAGRLRATRLRTDGTAALEATAEAWHDLLPSLDACLERKVVDRAGCISAAANWVSEAQALSVELPAEVVSVQPRLTGQTYGNPDCGTREAVVDAAKLALSVPEIPWAEAWLRRLPKKSGRRPTRPAGVTSAGTGAAIEVAAVDASVPSVGGRRSDVVTRESMDPGWSASSRRAVGGTLAGIGIAGVVASGVAAPTTPDAPGLAAFRGANVASWAVAGTGAAVVLTGLQPIPAKPRRIAGGILAGVGLALAAGTEVALADRPRGSEGRTVLIDANATGWAISAVGAAVFTTSWFTNERTEDR